MRPIISYDDIVPSDSATPKPAMNPPAAPPPAKKRKTNPHQQRQGGPGNGRGHPPMQHWDDPGNQDPQMPYDDVPAAAASASGANGAAEGAGEEYYEEEEEDEEESRELTHDEIWDDSALIEAWNSATAEYERFHGKGKSWKDQPVKKSPLWYNVPPETTSKPKASTSTANGATGHNANGAATAADSAPLNFDTFVPTHDPSLAAAAAASAMAAPAADGAAMLGTGAEAANVSQDEAFSRAMQAMYWSGYWTAVYHCRRNETQQNDSAAGAIEEQQEDAAEEDEAEDEDMLPAQR